MPSIGQTNNEKDTAARWRQSNGRGFTLRPITWTHYLEGKMIDLMSQALQFRDAFDQPILLNFTRYGFLREKLYRMQAGLIDEESKEFLDACEKLYIDPHCHDNRTEVLKELADLIYVCYQFAATYNLDLDEALDRIHKSNMSKLDEQGKPIYRKDGKVLKSDRYKPPQLDDLVEPSNTHSSEEYNVN